MCGLLVVTDPKCDQKVFEESLKTLENRGPDQTRIEMIGRGRMGFTRLAIMGVDEKGMQPFHREGIHVVCNGELYGFRPVKRKLSFRYQFISDSDCEIIPALYLDYGTSMFKKLDSEFAMVLFDERTNEWIAARDPIGIRPLFYGYSKDGYIAFGSTATSLMELCVEVHPFPPGHYYKNGKFTAYCHITKTGKKTIDSIEEACARIHDELIEGVVKRMDADVPCGYLLSGGLDSSLVCAIAQRNSKTPIRTFAIGMDEDAIDLKYARIVADYIGSIHTEVIITKADVIHALPNVIHTLETWDITTIRASIGMYLLCKYIHEHTNVRVLFTGEISDELFGYKYTDFAPDALSFQKEAEKRVNELYMYDVLRADRCISSQSLEGRVPFGDLKFVKTVMSINPEIKMNHYHMGKYLLRHAFEKDNLLPKEILFRDKAAFSDAVGHSLVDDLKQYASQYYSDEVYEEKCKQYILHTPYTKEALLYREIFESYFSGMSDLIKDYWLPNQSWDGCKVSDPSARYLSNYGASGK